MTNKSGLFLITISLMMITNCSDNVSGTDDPDKPGSHNLEFSISGDVEDEKTGIIGFFGAGESSFANESDHMWQLLSEDSDPGPQTFRLDFIYMDLDEKVSRPVPGTYDVGSISYTEDPDSPVFTVSYVNTQQSIAYSSAFAEICGEEYAHTGTLTIDTSTEELVTGKFAFDAFACDQGSISATINLTGEFTAPRLDLQ